MTELLIENEQDKLEITEEIETMIQAVCDMALKTEECNFDAEVSITFTDNENIHQINFEHRGIDRPTDVLSFPMIEFDEDGNADSLDFEYDGDFVMLGDIVISTEQALLQAKEFGHSIKRELAFLCAHSMLHLLGYDHEISEEDEKIMFEKQENILNKLNITREN